MRRLQGFIKRHKHATSFVAVLCLVALIGLPVAAAKGPFWFLPDVFSNIQQEEQSTVAEISPQTPQDKSDTLPTDNPSVDTLPTPGPRSVQLTIGSTVQTSLMKTGEGSPLLAQLGDTITATYTITNSGTSPTEKLVFYATVPAGTLVPITGARYTNVTPPPALDSIATIDSSAWAAQPLANTTGVYLVANTQLAPGERWDITLEWTLASGSDQNASIQAAAADIPSSGATITSKSGLENYSTKAGFLEYYKKNTQEQWVLSHREVKALSTTDALFTVDSAATGYTQWNTKEDGTGASYQPGDIIPISLAGLRSITLYPYTPPVTQHRVEFYSNGQLLITITMAENATDKRIFEPSPPLTRPGYVLEGWFTAAGIQWNFATDMVTENTSLTARWVPVVTEHRVTFYPRWENQPPTTVTVKAGDLFTPPTVVRPGYRIAQWNTDQGVPWDFEIHRMPAADLALYALWEADPAYQYTVTFDPGAGKVTPPSAKYTAGEKITKPTATRDYYLLSHWEIGKGIHWIFEKDTMPAKNITLTAGWIFDVKNATLPVSFITGEGSVVPPTQQIKAGEAIKRPDSPRKAGYTFLGWRRAGDSTDWDFATTLEEKHFATPFVLEARWIENSKREVTVYFHTRGGTPTPATQKVMPGSLVEKPVGVYRDGHDFAGWTIRETIDRVPWVFERDRVSADFAELHLYAQWTSTVTAGPGRNRIDTSPNLPSKKGTGTTILPDFPTGPPTEILPPPAPTEPNDSTGNGSVTVGKPPAVGTAPTPEINPETGGMKTPAPKTSPKKEQKQKNKVDSDQQQQAPENPMQLPERWREQIKEATMQELGMISMTVIMVLAAVLLFILGLTRYRRR